MMMAFDVASDNRPLLMTVEWYLEWNRLLASACQSEEEKEQARKRLEELDRDFVAAIKRLIRKEVEDVMIERWATCDP